MRRVSGSCTFLFCASFQWAAVSCAERLFVGRALSYGYASSVLRSRVAATAQADDEGNTGEAKGKFEAPLHDGSWAADRWGHYTSWVESRRQEPRTVSAGGCSGRAHRASPCGVVSEGTGGFALSAPKGGLAPLARILLRRLAAVSEGCSVLQTPRAWQKATRRALGLIAPPDRANVPAMGHVVSRVSSVAARCTDPTAALCPPRGFHSSTPASPAMCTLLAAHPAHTLDLTPRVSQVVLAVLPSAVPRCGAGPPRDARAAFYRRALFTAYARAFDLAHWDARRGHLVRAALRVNDILEAPSPGSSDALEQLTEDARWLFRPPHVRVGALVSTTRAATDGVPSQEARLLEQLLLAPPGFYQLPVAPAAGAGDPDIAADAALGQMLADDAALHEWWLQCGLAADPSWVEPGDDDAARPPAEPIAPADVSRQRQLAHNYITRTAEVVRRTLLVYRGKKHPVRRAHATFMHRLAFLLRVRGGGVDADAIAWWCRRGFNYSCGGTAPGAAVVLHASPALNAAVRRDLVRAALGGVYDQSDASCEDERSSSAIDADCSGFYAAPLFMLVRTGAEAAAVARRVLTPSNCRIVYNRAAPRGPQGDRHQWVGVSCPASVLLQDPPAATGPGASNAAWRGLMAQAGMPPSLCRIRPVCDISDVLRSG